MKVLWLELRSLLMAGLKRRLQEKTSTNFDFRTLARSDARTLGRPDPRTPGRTGVRTPGRSDAYLPPFLNFCGRRGEGPGSSRATPSRAGRRRAPPPCPRARPRNRRTPGPRAWPASPAPPTSRTELIKFHQNIVEFSHEFQNSLKKCKK